MDKLFLNAVEHSKSLCINKQVYKKSTLLLFTTLLISFLSFSQNPVTSATTVTEAATPSSYTEGAQLYQWGQGNNLRLQDVTYNGETYFLDNDFTQTKYNIVRVNGNGGISYDRFGIFVENNGTNFNYTASLPSPLSMETLLDEPIINRGANDVFKNSGSTAQNIERVDAIYKPFIVPNLPNLDKVGFLAIEKDGNSSLRAAAITSVDASGNPATFGPIITIQNGDYGLITSAFTVSFLANASAGANPTRTGGNTEAVGVCLITLSDLGIGIGDTVHGISFFDSNVPDGADLLDVANTTYFPNATGGGADIYGGLGAISTSLGIVSGTLYEDINGNGTQDSNEGGIENVSVTILASDGSFQTATTDSEGNFSGFLIEGNATITINESDPDLPPNFTRTEGSLTTVVTAIKGQNVSSGKFGYTSDFDNDGIIDLTDLDDDNDGILDTSELTVSATTYDPLGDEDGDKIVNYLDTTDDNISTDSSITDYTTTGTGGIPDVYDTDDDGIPNHLDLDADNDGIPDNIEGQPTASYVAPTGVVGANGLDNAYENNDTSSATSFSIQNTDSLGNDDYLDTDSDNDGVDDTTEANLTLSGTVGTNGLDNFIDNGDNYTDVNGNFDTTPFNDFPDTPSGGEINWRDASVTGELDRDNDGVPDATDIDDDNDGILDTDENNFTGGVTFVTTPTAFWSFENSTNDVANGNNQVSTTGTIAYSATAIQGSNSLDFDGSTSILYSQNGTFMEAADTTISFSAWIQPTSITGTRIIYEEGGAFSGLVLWLNGNTLTATASTAGAPQSLTHPTTLTLDSAWHHVAVTFDTGALIVYLDGVASTTLATGFANISNHDNDGGIGGQFGGASANGSAGFYQGLMDAARYSNTEAWSPADIATEAQQSTVSADADGDGIPNQFDLDSDNDGIPDNIEGQTTNGYIAPTGSVGANGLYNVYENNDTSGATSFSIVNTDGTDEGDYLDTDADDDGVLDRIEADSSLSGMVGSNGLDTNYEASDDYTDVNGTYDNTQADNFPDVDADVASGGDVDYRDADSSFSDNDNDGVPDATDLDDDNDGILDTIEQNGNTTRDTDSDGIFDHLDLDADNDGIPDNIEAQTTQGYSAPSGVFGADGVDTEYAGGLTPIDTDGDGDADYLETDSDNDGLLDNVEAGLTLTGTYGANGLDNAYDNGDNYTDVNGSFDNTQTNNFPDLDFDVFTTGDVDYRDNTFTVDNDLDGVSNEDDLDDDNDGILDTEEGRQVLLSEAGFNNLTATLGDNAGATITPWILESGTATNVIKVDGPGGTTYGTGGPEFDATNNSGNYFTINGSAGVIYQTFTLTETSIVDFGGYISGRDGNTGNGSVSIYSGTGSGGTIQASTGPKTTSANETWKRIANSVELVAGTYSFVVDLDANLNFDEAFAFASIDSDGDGVVNEFDLDADNDGIPDNIEAQTTQGYISPTGSYNLSGIDLAYGAGLTPVNTDGTDNPDYLDLNSDNEGGFDIVESGAGLTDADLDGVADGISTDFGTNGLINTLETGDVDQGYTDVNGEYDNTFTTILTDTDGDVNSGGGDLDYRDAVVGNDTDGDGVPDTTDIDDDNDGILDTDEGTGDLDGDGKANNVDIDADGDGIPDNVEAQTTTGYIAPTGSVGANGLYNVYENNDTTGATSSLPLTNTDVTGDPDYLDTDSDDDGTPDIQENGDSDTTASGTDTDGDGLDDNFEGSDTNDGFDVNDEIDTPQSDLPDVDSDVTTTGDVDYRDDTDDAVTPVTGDKLLWVRSDKDAGGTTTLTSWTDQTGAVTNTINGNPTIDEYINFNPIVTFDGAGDYIQTNLSTNSSTYPDLTVFAVLRPAAATPGSVWGEDNGDWDRFLGFGGTLGNGINGTTFTGVYTTGQNVITSVVFDEDVASGSFGFIDGQQIINFSSNHGPETTNNFQIGAIGSGIDNFNGSVSEIIVFNEILTDIKRQSIDSYLAIKAGITLDATDNSGSIVEGDYILSDQSTKIWNYTTCQTYSNDIAGIGRDDGFELNQKQSKSQNQDAEVHLTIGLGTIADNNPSNVNTFTSNKDFLVWGNNNGSLTTTTTNTIICAPENTMNRIWKIVETGSVGEVQLAFDAATIDAALNTPSTLKILKIADDAALTSNVETIPLSAATTVNGTNQYTVTYNFDGTKYFTFAEVNGIFWNGDANSGAGAWTGGSGASNIASTNANDIDKVMIIDSETSLNHATLNVDARVECVWIKENSILTVTDNHFLEFDEDFILDGNLKLVGDAQLIQTHIGQTNVQGTGKVYIDQTATVPNQYRYHYWSSPVVEVGKSTFTVGNVMKDGTTPTSLSSTESTPKDITFITEATSYDGSYDTNPGDGTDPITIANYWIWSYISGTDGSNWVHKRNTASINRGEGFTMKSTGNPAGQNFTFVGTPNDGTISIAVSENTNSLIGNPYPSAVDAIDFINKNADVIDGTLYFWQHEGEAGATSRENDGHFIGGYQGGYATRNLGTSVAAQTPVEGTNGLGSATYDEPGRYIAVGQSFFVGATTTGNITFENSHRNYQANDGTNSIFLKGGKKKKSQQSKTNIGIVNSMPTLKIGFEYQNNQNQEIHRQIAVVFDGKLSNEHDFGYDSPIYDIQATDVYWKFNEVPNNKYCIAGVSSIKDDTEVPISIKSDNSKIVKFIIDSKNFLNDVYLKDKLTNSTQKLSGSAISLYLDAGTYEDRFSIVFKSLQGAILDNEEISDKKFQIYFNKKEESLNFINPNNFEISRLKLTSLTGKLIKEFELKNNVNSIDLKNIAHGIYIVNMETNMGSITREIAIY